jgi:hypothetical protein
MLPNCNIQFFRCFMAVAVMTAYSAPALCAQSDTLNAAHSRSGTQAKEKYVKKGWSIAPLPAISYDTDLGLQLGAIVDMYYFGDGSTYPEYLHKITAEVCYFTKGSGIYHIFYDSKYLIRGLRLTASASYIPNTMMPFYGFNGYASPFLRSEKDGFYAVRRNMFRAMADIQGEIAEGFGWAAGISFFNYRTGPVDVKEYRDRESLYSLYRDNGIIRGDEASGGSHIEFKAGLVYDTRDHEPDPSRGIYTSAVLYGSPDMINRRGYGYMKLAATFCHYVPILSKRLTFAYRVNYQGTLAGSVPFYVQQNYTTLFLRQINSDILGGAISVRGVQYNRIVSDGVAWANAELRIRLFDFRLLKQEWYLSTNPFFDMGMSVQPFRLEEMKSAATEHEKIYSGSKETLHMSAGLGLKLVMNNNFVLSAEWGKPFDRRDGNQGFYLNLNYIF